MARTPEQQAALDAMRAAKAQAPIPEFTTSPGAAPEAPGMRAAPPPGGPGPAGSYVPPTGPAGPSGPSSAYHAPGTGGSMPPHPMGGVPPQAAPAAPKVPPVGARDPYGAGAWQAERAAQEARSAAAPVQQATGSWTERLNARTAAMNEASAARAASTEAAAARVNGFTNAVGDARAANNTAIRSALSSPGVRGAGRLIGGYGVFADGLAANEAAGQGDYATAIDKAGTGIAGAAMLGSNPAALAAGGAYLAGHAVGDLVVNPILDRTESGRAFKDTLGSGLNKVANFFGGGVDADRYAAVEKFNRGEGPHPGAEGARQAAPVAPVAPAPAAQGSNFSPEHQALMKERYGTPQQAATPNTNLVSRQGNSFSGNNIKEGWQYEDGPGSRAPKMGVSVMDTSEGRRQDGLELQRLVAERQQREAGFAGNQPGGGLSGFGGGTLSSGLRESHNRQSTAMSTSSPGLRSQRQQDALDMQKAQLAQQAETSRAQIGATREGNELNAKTSMRGQDMQLMGHKMTNQLALANRQYEMFKDQRNHDLDVKKFEQTQTDANRTAREAEDKAWTTNAEKRFVTRVDGKDVVDANKVAEFTRAADATVPKYIELLKQTGSPASLAKAEELNKRGKAALGPEDLKMLHQLMDLRAVSRAGHGLWPGQGTHVETDNLLAYRPKGKDPATGKDRSKDTGLFGNPITVLEGGMRVPTNKMEYGPDDNAWLPTLQPRRTDLTSIR